jgi:hypothetical protein
VEHKPAPPGAPPGGNGPEILLPRGFSEVPVADLERVLIVGDDLGSLLGSMFG